MFINSGLAGRGVEGLGWAASGKKRGELRRGVLFRKGCMCTLTLLHCNGHSSTRIALSLKTWLEMVIETIADCMECSKTSCMQGTVDWTDPNTAACSAVAQKCKDPLVEKKEEMVVYITWEYISVTMVYGCQSACSFFFDPPAWNLQSVIWFPFNISSVVFLPSPFALSPLFLVLLMVHLLFLFFSSRKLEYVLLRVGCLV